MTPRPCGPGLVAPRSPLFGCGGEVRLPRVFSGVVLLAVVSRVGGVTILPIPSACIPDLIPPLAAGSTLVTLQPSSWAGTERSDCLGAPGVGPPAIYPTKVKIPQTRATLPHFGQGGSSELLRIR